MAICKCGSKLQNLNTEKGRIQQCTGCQRQWPCVRSDDIAKSNEKQQKQKQT
jgi:hypothetical protein